MPKIISPERIRRDAGGDIGEAFRQSYRALRAELEKDETAGVVLMMGMPGAGKSTYVDQAEDDWVYFDAVSARPSARRAVVNMARELGKPVAGVYMATPFEVCLERNAERGDDDRTPVDAIERARDLFIEYPPSLAEGFDRLTAVHPAEKSRSVDYLERALAEARKVLTHETYSIIHRAARASAGGKARARYRRETRELTKEALDFQGPVDAPYLFVAAAPSGLESARCEPLVGPDAATFKEKYLAPLGLVKEEVAIGFAVPVEVGSPADYAEHWRERHLVPALQKYTKAKVVALGRVAKRALGDEIDFLYLPHPSAVRRHGDSGEVGRKLRALSKRVRPLDRKEKTDDKRGERPVVRASLADLNSEIRQGNLTAPVCKADEAKQIVYSVVLDPYQIDLQGDWLPPAEIESTAHDFQMNSRTIGFRHLAEAEGASLVETFVEPYPSPEDRDNAFRGLPHKAYRRPYGNDWAHSGAWVAGVKLPDELWQMYLDGQLDAFSIGGFSVNEEVSAASMPEVEFVELGPVSNADR